ncbi:HutD family protein [Ectopseudomonas mendocina]|uniref:HutD family protein n=1 Tax=Ectopseudomonas mendocina TaxID=300 RepID=A0ABD7RU89_ECTME|nr:MULTISPECIES: HutD family protein [Pseudomonas]TRO11224.1 HutD family protein [Pseudomonas mendocina]TRO17650.1 HutD family protein [Pseudomonas mendocina]TRO31038.1 HutD family protein [Pseudomonas sp. ALS1131]
MPCILLDPATARAMPWKNGGGTTVELAISPADAGLEDFAWRISTAQVAVDGAFSSFPGIDRSLAVLAGNGVCLQRADGQREMLLSGDAIAVFSGEEAISAQLLDGPITDLNLMTRRGVWSHELRLVRLQGEQVLVNDAELLLLWNAAPEALHYQLPEGGQQVLAAHSGVLLENEQGRLTLESDQPSPLYVGRMRRG